LKVQLDKKTVKGPKSGHRELKKRQYKVASSREDIDRILTLSCLLRSPRLSH